MKFERKSSRIKRNPDKAVRLHPLIWIFLIYQGFFDRKIKKYGSPLYHRLPSYLVEMRGVEPLSESALTGLSPGAVKF